MHAEARLTVLGRRLLIRRILTDSIFTELGLPLSEDDNRRVLAVLAYLNA